ncbi:phage minor head protein [Stappia indica]|uniref:Phage Mu protein F like protein n=1 Tax=Stappia indica TaxID=538381 RepID=A0A285TST9_9HYPH|nr:phage minor head protein [Stappia indica]SOC26873.1 Phage Mu protein F like protein [Stappia indica]
MAEPDRDRFRAPREVTDYFRDKTSRPRFSWLDVWGEEHAHAFTVAKATETELIGAFRRSLDTAITDGQTFENWKKGIRGELERLGWAKPRLVEDPDGIDPPRLVDFTSDRRLKTIFWSNMRAARAAGQWNRVQRTKAALPFLLYVRTAAADPRPEHLVWAGTLLPVDDPWWDTHFPPNGWGCKCAVRQVSRFEARRLVGDREITIDGEAVPVSETRPEIQTRPFVNRRTGEITQVPEGIDAGWHTNPGKARSRTLVTRLVEELQTQGEATARTQIARVLDGPDVRAVIGLPERVRLPVAVAPQAAETLSASGQVVTMSSDTIVTKMSKHALVTLELLGRIQEIVDEGRMLDEGRGDAQRQIYLELEGLGWVKLVLGRSKDGFLYVRTLYQVAARKALKSIEENGGR